MTILAIRNGLWNAMASVAGSLTALAGSIIIVRSLDPGSYGTFSYYMWLASIAITFGTLAFPPALTKVTSELIGREHRHEAGSLALLVVFGLFLFNLLVAGAIVTWALTGSPEQRPYLVVIAVLIVPNGVAGILLSVFWGQERYKPVSIMFVFASLLQITLIVLAHRAHLGVTGFIGASLSANVVQSVGLIVLLARAGQSMNVSWRPVRLPRWETVGVFLAFVAPATLTQLFAVIVWERSEVFLLNRLSTIEEVGIYSLSYTIVTMCMYLGWSLLSGFFPAMSRDYGAGAWDRIRVKFQQAAVVAALYSIPLSVGGWVTLERLIVLLYGTKMLPAVPVAQVLFIGLVPAVFASLLGFAVTAVGGIWLHVRLGFLMSVVNIGTSLILIPLYGAIGAALSNTSAQTIHVAILVVIVNRRYGLTLPWQQMGQIAAAGLLAACVLPYFIQMWISGPVGLVVAVSAAGCLYIGAVWRLGGLRVLSVLSTTPAFSQELGESPSG